MTIQDSNNLAAPLAGDVGSGTGRKQGIAKYAWAAGLLLVGITVAVYMPARRCGFVWDDNSYVVDNQTLRSPDGLRQIWLEIGATAQYYPMVYTTYWLEYRLWELDPAGYHVVNILLHALVAILLWRVLTMLNVPGAWVIAAVFAVHPVHVQSVAWITQRKNVLSGVFYLGAALAYLRYALPLGDGAGRGRSPVLYLAALLLFLCALLSKTVTCTLPVILLLVVWWKHDRIAWADFRALLPFFLLGIAFGLVTIRVESHEVRALGQEWDRSLVDRCLIAGQGLWFYLYKLVWPRQLSFIYTRWQIDTHAWQQYLYPLAAIVGVALTWIARGRMGKGAVIAVLCFVVTLFPAMGFFNIYFTRYSFVADQWQYIASIFAIGLVVAAAYRSVDRSDPAARGALAVLAGVILVTLGTLTWRHVPAFKDVETIWLDTLEKNPTCWLAHNNLGNLYEKQAKQYEKQDKLDESQGKLDQAIQHHGQALLAKPRFDANVARSYHNLGNALAAQGKYEEAASQYRQSLQVDPNFAPAHNNLANALLRRRDVAGAIQHFQLSLQLKPRDAAIHYNLAMVLTMVRHIEGAVEHLRETVRLEPDWLKPISGLAWILAADSDANIRDPSEAIQLAEHAVKLTGRENGTALDLLAAAYASSGQFDRAIATAQEALALAEASQADRLAGIIRQRLELYEQGTPFVKPEPTQDTDQR